MKIFIDQKEAEIKSSTVGGILAELGINPESVIIELNGSLVTEDGVVKENDSLSLIRVFSGG